DYLETVIETVETNTTTHTPETKQMIEKAKEILNEPKFMNQTGIRSLIDEDARVGRKSKTINFFGYKAYFRKSILEKIEALEALAYIQVSASAYHIDESEFSYNKDSDQWFCSLGNETVNRNFYKRSRKDSKSGFQEGYKYYFDLVTCKGCPKHDACAKKSARKVLNIGINTLEFYEISQSQKMDDFKEKYKKRASIEGKNAEFKRFHGLGRARSYGLVSMSKQAKLAAIAVNLKRIAAIMTANFSYFVEKFVIFRINFVF
ncbi:MAG: transposase, partial [Eubacteriaceae bacterium]|nr:transposase [Eubacteriaceae bacterium]